MIAKQISYHWKQNQSQDEVRKQFQKVLSRKESQVKLLKEKGAKYILNTSASSFKSDFIELVNKLDAKLYFDAVGSDQISVYIKESPTGSRIILYANLSNSNFSADPRDILQHGKTIEGFSLPLWLRSKSIIQLLRHTARVKSYLKKEGTPYKAKYAIQDVNIAINEYRGLNLVYIGL